jgi:co-chaperonin GroES (HSP10)
MAYHDESLAELLERDERKTNESFAVPTRCFLKPTAGRVIAAQDEPKGASKLIITPGKYKARPTTGRIIACSPGTEVWLNKRVLFSPMSGTAVKFKNRPAWIALSVDEIIAEIDATDEELDGEQPLPLDGSYA